MIGWRGSTALINQIKDGVQRLRHTSWVPAPTHDVIAAT